MKKLALLIATSLIAVFSVQAQVAVDMPSIEKVKTFSFENKSTNKKFVYVTVSILRSYDHCSEGIQRLRDFKTHNVATREMNQDKDGNMVSNTQQNLIVFPVIDYMSTTMPIERDPHTGELIPRICTTDIKYIQGEKTIKFDIIPGAKININTYDGVEFVGLSFKEPKL